jgi:hypothetical protein
MESTCYRLKRYKFPRKEMQHELEPVELALVQHTHCLVTVNEYCEINHTRYYHWIAVRHSVVYDSLCCEPCMIRSYVSKIDAIYFVELKPDQT